MSKETTDEERREAYGWCPKCGAGNDREGYAHLSTCPTLRPQRTSRTTGASLAYGHMPPRQVAISRPADKAVTAHIR
jgi:hypothetical protein